MLKLYLDTSVILKRYVTEEETELADDVFEKAETGEVTIAFSLWSIGEALGVLDEKRRRGWLTQSEFDQTLNLFSDELVKLMRLKALEVLPLQAPILTSTWSTIMNYPVCEADALQIITCNFSGCDFLLTDDEGLAQTSAKAGVNVINLSKDGVKLKKLLQTS